MYKLLKSEKDGTITTQFNMECPIYIHTNIHTHIYIKINTYTTQYKGRTIYFKINEHWQFMRAMNVDSTININIYILRINKFNKKDRQLSLYKSKNICLKYI